MMNSLAWNEYYSTETHPQNVQDARIYEINIRNVRDSRNALLNRLLEDRDNKVIYFDGWNGFGAAPVLRSIALLRIEALPPKLCIDRIIYIDCSEWENRRTMQRKIAEELKLNPATMAMFDMQDEDDDYNGVDHGSRDIINSVADAIDQTLMDGKSMMIFLNGSDDEIDITRFGIQLAKYIIRSNIVIWTFKRRLLTIRQGFHEVENKLRYSHLLVAHGNFNRLSSSELNALLHEEAASIVVRHQCMKDIDLTTVIDCCLYMLLLHYSFHNTTGFDWTAHASNYWTCDGITQKHTRDIVNALHKEIRWNCDSSRLGILFEKFMEDPKAPFLAVKDDLVHQSRHFRWASITSKNLTMQEEDMHTMLERASSLFVGFERSNDPPGLPNGLFKHCSNLCALTLSFCTFSFDSPPFIGCHKIKFLGLDHCTDNKAREGKYSVDWTHLGSLWVLHLRYTDWDDILSDEKIKIMTNLTELNIEGVRCWRYTSQLQKRLPYLERLRIIKPAHHVVPSTDTNDSFMYRERLEILDLSGNKDMKNLPTSITKATSLHMLVLDGCDELENVALPSGFPSSLRSFSFDGYGPPFHLTLTVDLPPINSSSKHPSDANKSDVKTLKISLHGCKQLENLFLRGLPNLIELDLSGSAIKILDFNTMVVDVPNLKRLFLLGCEHLHAVNWVRPYFSVEQPKLELLCIDTRPLWSIGCERPCVAKTESFQLQVHGILADIRLGRSLWEPVHLLKDQLKRVYLNIHITNSAVYGDFVQVEATNSEMPGPGIQLNFVLAKPYDDVVTKIGHASSPVQAFPPSPTPQSDRHIEICGGSDIIESEMKRSRQSISWLIKQYANSLNVHDISTISRLPDGLWYRLKWCCVARCPRLDTVFPYYSEVKPNQLETVWASDLLMILHIWSKSSEERSPSFGNLQHLHLESCPRLQFVLPVWVHSFPNLRTLHIIHCGNLGHVFVLDGWYPEEISVHGVRFPKLTTIHLFDLPKLQRICEVKMLAPALETVRIRGCFGLRRLPALEDREPGMKKLAVEMEKDVWDALEWDGLAAGHHPDLFGPPVHSRYYKRRLLKGTVLR